MDSKPNLPSDNPAGDAQGSSWSIWTPLNAGLLLVCGYLLYKIVALHRPAPSPGPQIKRLPKLKRRDFTLQELRKYDGKGTNPDDPERILVAVNGTVFDMSNNGRRFYGPGGAYAIFGGRDASRALASFSLTEDQFREEYDDLSDLKPSQMESIREWERQYRDKYDVVGKLLKPGEQPTVYSDDEDDANKASADAQKPKTN